MRRRVFIILLVCFTISIIIQTGANAVPPDQNEKKTKVGDYSVEIATIKKEMEKLRAEHSNEIAAIKKEMEKSGEKYKSLANEVEVSNKTGKNAITFIDIVLAVIGIFMVIITGFSIYNTYDFHKKIQKADKELESIKTSKKEFLEGLNNDKVKHFEQMDKRFDELKENLFNAVPGDHLLKGNANLEKGDFKMARIHFEIEIATKKDQANAFFGLARAYQGLDRMEDALKAIEKAIELDESGTIFNAWGQLSMLKAEILMDMESYQQAADVLRNEVLKVNPDSKKAANLLELCINKTEGKKKK